MQLFNRYVSTRSLTLFAGELLLIFGSVALAASLQDTPDLAGNVWKIGLVTVVSVAALTQVGQSVNGVLTALQVALSAVPGA